MHKTEREFHQKEANKYHDTLYGQHEISKLKHEKNFHKIIRDMKVNDHSKLSDKSKDLHKKINNKSKSQNESIAILLTEAALLLSKKAVVYDKIPTKVSIDFFNKTFSVNFDNLSKNNKDYNEAEVLKVLNKFINSSKSVSNKIESRFCSETNKLNDKSYTGIDKDIKKYSDIPGLKLTDMYIRKGYSDEPKYILCLYGHYPIDPEHGFSLLFNGTSVIVDNITLNNKKYSYITRCNGYTQE